jgi:hypothetical protein
MTRQVRVHRRNASCATILNAQATELISKATTFPLPATVPQPSSNTAGLFLKKVLLACPSKICAFPLVPSVPPF